MRNHPEQSPPKTCGVMVPPSRGVIKPYAMKAPGLARAMCEAMEAAGVIDERFLNWVADPVARTITFSVPSEVK